MFIIEQLQKYVSPSPKSLTILQELQAKEDAERAAVIKKREEKNPPYEVKEKDNPNLINPEDLPFNLN